MKHYKALRNITGDELIAKNTEELTVEQLGGEDSVGRLLRIGAIEESPSAKAKKEVPSAPAANEETAGGKPADETKEK